MNCDVFIYCCICGVANFVVQFIELFSDFWLLKKKKKNILRAELRIRYVQLLKLNFPLLNAAGYIQIIPGVTE